MPYELRQFVATIPAGTALAAPVTLSIAMPARIVRRVRARIPPGPNFLMGWALAAAGVNVIPWNAGAWIVGDDEVLSWDLEGQIESGAWQVRGYNTGRYDHAVYLVFELDPPQLVAGAGGAELVDSSQLGAGSFVGGTIDGGAGGAGGPAQPPGPGPTPGPSPAPTDWHAAAIANATAALEAAYGDPVTVEPVPPPDPGTAAAAVYDAARQAALAALAAIRPG